MSESRRKRREDPTLVAKRLLARATTRVNIVTWTLRIVGIIILFIYIAYLLSAFNDPGAVFNISNALLVLTIVTLTTILFLVEILVIPGLLISALYPSTGAIYVYTIRLYILDFVFKGIGVPPGVVKQDLLGNISFLAPLAYLYDKPVRDQWVHQFLYGFLTILLLAAILSGVAFAFQNEVKLAGYAFGLGQIIVAFGYMNDLLITLTMDPTTLGTLFGSSMFTLALISYLYFEYALQTGYVGNLLNPTVGRQKRVTKALERLERFRLGLTTEKGETKKESKEELHKTQKAVASSGSTLAKKFGATALVYMLEQAQDSLFAKPGGEREKLTGRLQRYHDGILRGDPELDAKLAGATHKINPVAILLFAGGSMLLRLGFVVFFTWFILNPSTFLDYVRMSPSVSRSIEVTQPEGILLVLTPIVVAIITLGILIGRIQEVGTKGFEERILEEQVTQYIRELQRKTAAKRAGITLQEKEGLLHEPEKKKTKKKKPKKAKKPKPKSPKSSRRPPKK